MPLLTDIVALKKKYNLLEEDATDEKQREWYDFCLKHGLIECEYEGKNLVGFMEYVRLNEVPKDMDNIVLDLATILTAPVLFVGNCIADKKGVLWRLRRRVMNKNKVNIFCWHRKKNGLIRSFRKKEK